MKNLQKESLKLYQRRHYIRCLDCVTDFFDELFSGFCDDMDDIQSGLNITALLSSKPY